MPPTLYQLVLEAISKAVHPDQKLGPEYRKLPNDVLFDMYYQIHIDKKNTTLSYELSDIEIFDRLIKVHSRNVQFLQIYQYLEYHLDIVKTLILSFNSKCNDLEECFKDVENMISIGLRLGSFLNTCGQYAQSTEVLTEVKRLCNSNPNLINVDLKLFDCYCRLFQAKTHYCDFHESARIQELILELVSKLNCQNKHPNLGNIYSEFSFYYFMKGDYDTALHWSLLALEQITVSSPPSLIIDVLRQAAVSCVVKRKLKTAKLLIENAVILMKSTYPECHPKVPEVLLDYGFFLLNSDSIAHSVKVYKRTLSIQKQLFMGDNLKIAISSQDLAYALYVKEYGSGNFSEAKDIAEDAIKMLSEILPPNHFLCSNAKRVAALILEEIAIDLPMRRNIPFPLNWQALQADTKTQRAALLKRAEELHQQALLISLNTFGEKNVQTAKHYGNLGRLYQTMKNYEKGEALHLLAISIKSELLGEDDYEVGLSIGHLASLYTFHMEKFKEAEKLYLKSIEIGLKLFGETHSGLEYDYRGLMQIYTETSEIEKLLYYGDLLNQWETLREKLVQDEADDDLSLNCELSNIPLEHLLKKCSNMVS